MYKYLIVAIAFMSIGGGGYYLRSSGGAELIDKALSNDRQTIMNPPTTESVSGLYVCGISSGCDNKYVLLLKADQTAEMILLTPETTATEPKDVEETPSEVITPPTTEGLESTTTATTETTPDTNTASGTSLEISSSENLQEMQGENTSTATDIPVAPLESLDVLSNEITPNTDKGSWDWGVQNMLVVTFTEHGTSTYDIPQKFVIKNVGANTLSKVNYTKSVYEYMTNPTFIRQE